MEGKRVYVETYGCAFARAEGEMIEGVLENDGFCVTRSLEHADAIILVTCHVKEATENKILQRIKNLGALYPEKPLVVYGCLPQAYPERVRKVNPRASLVGNFSLDKIPRAVSLALEGKRVEFLERKEVCKLNLPRKRKNPVIGIVPVAEGCTGSCSYCSTRLSRGKLFSYPEEEIVKEVLRFLDNGAREIWLTAQDAGAYGIDRGTNIAELLGEVAKIPRAFRVRVGMLNPAHAKRLLPALVKAFESERVYKFLHLPVQSGSDRILQAMGRNYTVKDFLHVVGEFRERFPMLQLWTDVIVGFPGESEEDFELTKKLVKEAEPDWVNVSKFSSRPKTEASKMKQVSTEIKKERSRELSTLIRKIVLRANRKWKGWEGTALISEKGKKGLVGRNFAYKPIVVHEEENLLGRFVKVKIYRTENVLFGRVLEVIE